MMGFILTGVITLAFSLVLLRLRIVSDLSRSSSTGIQRRRNRKTFWMAEKLAPKNVNDPIAFWIQILERLVLSFSDQQLLTGLLLLIISYATFKSPGSVSLQTASRIAFFSQITHASTLMALRHYFTRYFWMTLVRLLITMSAFFLWAFIVVYQIHMDNRVFDSGKGYLVMTDRALRVSEFTGLVWVYLYVISYLYVSEKAILARAAISRVRPGSSYEPIEEWIADVERTRQAGTVNPPNAFDRCFRRPLTNRIIKFYELYMRTASMSGRCILWTIGEFSIPWK